MERVERDGIVPYAVEKLARQLLRAMHINQILHANGEKHVVVSLGNQGCLWVGPEQSMVILLQRKQYQSILLDIMY